MTEFDKVLCSVFKSTVMRENEGLVTLISNSDYYEKTILLHAVVPTYYKCPNPDKGQCVKNGRTVILSSPELKYEKYFIEEDFDCEKVIVFEEYFDKKKYKIHVTSINKPYGREELNFDCEIHGRCKLCEEGKMTCSSYKRVVYAIPIETISYSVGSPVNDYKL